MGCAPRRVVVIGATGSIGRCALDVAASLGGEFKVDAVSALRSDSECRALAARFGAKAYCGEDAALRAVEECDAELCVAATVGESGVRPVMAAIGKGMDVALATKEVLVMAGGPVTEAARKAGVRILPVDSEHSAIWQCLGSAGAGEVERLVLTASGGPFLEKPADLSSVSPDEAVRHPKWKMGRKVSVDSATMMNKGFEIAEARWLFGVPEDRIDVIVHPQCIVHGMVEFCDGSTLAQLSGPDMRLAVQYALTSGARRRSGMSRLDLADVGTLSFSKPDVERFPCLALARRAYTAGGCAPAVLAAADEWAVEAFLSGKILFSDIADVVRRCLDAAPDWPCDSVDAALEAAAWTRSEISSGRMGVGR